MNEKTQPRLLVVGYEPYNEKMYPHTYDFLKLVNENFDLTYYGGDDRGVARLKIGCQIASPLNALTHPFTTLKYMFNYSLKNRKIKAEIGNIMAENFDVVVAIDHSALNHVIGFVKEGTKLIFWSHDIVCEDHAWRASLWIRRLVKENQEKIDRCHLIMIQDMNRKELLDKTIGSWHIPGFYLPVSIKYRDLPGKSMINEKNKIVLMQVGSIDAVRGTDQLIEHYQNMDEKVNLVLHGHISQPIMAAVDKVKRKPQCFQISAQLEEMRSNINKADIGFVANCSKNMNDRLYSKASGQLVEFLMQGIPVITFDSEEMGSFVEENKCGIYISTLSGIDSAITEIVTDYNYYSENAKNTFFDFFDLDMYDDQIKKALDYQIRS